MEDCFFLHMLSKLLFPFIIGIMVRKQVTLRDIANEAGVSIATVSYVLNDRQDQKISDAKRKKILQLANLYHYVKNPSASSLASGRHNVVSLLFPEAGSLLEDADRYRIAKRFHDAFLERGIRISIEGGQPSFFGQGSDAVIAVGIDRDRFLSIGDDLYVPFVAVDTLVDNGLFNQVVDDYDSVSGVLVSLQIASRSYRQYLESRFDVRYVSSEQEALEEGRSHPSPYLRNPALIALYEREGLPFKNIDAFGSKKVETIVERTLASARGDDESAHLKI